MYVRVTVMPLRDRRAFSVNVAVYARTVTYSDVLSLLLGPFDTTAAIPISEVIRLLAAAEYSQIWRFSGIGITGRSGSEYMIDTVVEYLQHFLNDYLAANPRQ